MNKRIIYHGSKQVVAEPEIRIAKFHEDFYYQSREYIAMCYKEGTVLE